MSYLKKINRKSHTVAGYPGGIVAGGNVRTPCGPRRIEMVCPGDLIVTRDQGLQAVRMILKREIVSADIDADPELAPIRLKPRALGPMMPQVETIVAPDHRILVPGYRLATQDDNKCCLLEARELAGVSDEAYVDRSATTLQFVSLIFDTHQLFCVNGLAMESFRPSKSAMRSLDKTLRNDLVERFPRLKHEPNAYPAADYELVEGAAYLPTMH